MLRYRKKTQIKGRQINKKKRSKLAKKYMKGGSDENCVDSTGFTVGFVTELSNAVDIAKKIKIDVKGKCLPQILEKLGIPNASNENLDIINKFITGKNILLGKLPVVLKGVKKIGKEAVLNTRSIEELEKKIKEDKEAFEAASGFGESSDTISSDIKPSDLTYAGLSYSFFDDENRFINKDMLQIITNEGEGKETRNIMFKKDFESSPNHLEYHLFQSLCEDKSEQIIQQQYNEKLKLYKEIPSEKSFYFYFKELEENLKLEKPQLICIDKHKIDTFPHPLSLLFKGLLIENNDNNDKKKDKKKDNKKDLTLKEIIDEINFILNGEIEKINPDFRLFQSIKDKINIFN